VRGGGRKTNPKSYGNRPPTEEEPNELQIKSNVFRRDRQRNKKSGEGDPFETDEREYKRGRETHRWAYGAAVRKVVRS